MVLSPDKILLIKQLGEEGYSSSKLVCYDLKNDSLFSRELPEGYNTFEFSDCGGHILFSDGEITAIFTCEMAEEYTVPYNLPIWEDIVSFNEGDIIIASNHCQMLLPLEDRTKNIIKNVENKDLFGPIVDLPDEIEEKINTEINNK